MGEFTISSKSAAPYIDIAANGNGDEKSFLILEAYTRLAADDARDKISILDIGPGGGSALQSFSGKLPDPEGRKRISFSLLELEGIQSDSLKHSRLVAEGRGVETSFYTGSATSLGDFFGSQSIDIVSTSAVVHEIYSYAGGYTAIDKTMQSIAGVLSPGGFYVYRDVYGVDRLSMHERSRHIYDRSSWVMFCKLFLNHYIQRAEHPYGHYQDRVRLSQAGKEIEASSIDEAVPLSVDAPIGLLREIQRHYITLRDHLWRNGCLGVIPELENPYKTSDWIDKRRGHKRVHYRMLDDDPLLKEMSTLNPEDGDYVVDGDIFDNTSDVRISELLSDIIEKGQFSNHWNTWSEWLKREGSETYFYLPLGELLGSVALNSFQATDGEGILLPTQSDDVLKVDRTYYNRYLNSKLSNPLTDSKQLILFELLPLKDKNTELKEKVASALSTLALHCSHDILSSIYTPIRKATR